MLEIGSGMGDATAAMAAADPDRDYLAVEVHTAGVANLLALVEARGLTNVRVARRRRAGPGPATGSRPASLDAVHVFFPDPWPKARHHKRRLIQPAHVALLALPAACPAGVLHCATDWAEYAEAMLPVLTADAAGQRPRRVRAAPGAPAGDQVRAARARRRPRRRSTWSSAGRARRDACADRRSAAPSAGPGRALRRVRRLGRASGG